MVSFLTVACGVYFGILLLMFLFQSKMIYFPTRGIVCTPADTRLEFEDLMLKTHDGVKINTWYVPARNPAAGTVIFCHGNGGNMCYSLDVAENFSKMNYNVLLFDYRGYGKSEGSPSEKGTYYDAQTAYDWLMKEKKIPEREIVVMGRSLGGSIAANLAKDNSPRLLILESSFTSTPDVAADAYRIFPVRLLCRYKYNTLDYIGKIKCPVLVIHSPDDEIIPYSHGKKLFSSAKEPKEFLQIRGGHNEGFDDSKEIYIEGLKKFLEEHK
ncbi:MAG: hypothetical protein A2X48_07650 [Lentisphaerae bacterium GWF2_49_21]|nr:MAG: hypothetical protein A2X48_07650 [Lentisphaerae bacterium GWF2_49_21]